MDNVRFWLDIGSCFKGRRTFCFFGNSKKMGGGKNFWLV